jgi:Arc/MetJ-type ribon-helix-helix transcriptional regulator
MAWPRFFRIRREALPVDGRWRRIDRNGGGRAGATEKLTINLGVVDLGQIDLLVQEGFYSNRTDLIRTAIRTQLASHSEEVKRTVARRTLTLGLEHISREDLERARTAGQMLRIQVVGLARIADDVSAELARATIQSVVVLGAFHASAAVRAALRDRIS